MPFEYLGTVCVLRIVCGYSLSLSLIKNEKNPLHTTTCTHDLLISSIGALTPTDPIKTKGDIILG